MLNLRYYSCSKFTVARFKPALVRRNVLFKTALLNTTLRDSMKKTAKPGLPAGWQAGLGQGLENDEYRPVLR
jgi:hypothetical protein